MSKQDRQGVRQASELEQKYDFSLLKELSGASRQQDGHLSQLQQQMTQFMVNMNGKIAELENRLETIYPIGAFYISANETDPTELFGGTWEFYTEGHLLIGMEQEEGTPPSMLQIADNCFVWKRTA